MATPLQPTQAQSATPASGAPQQFQPNGSPAVAPLNGANGFGGGTMPPGAAPAAPVPPQNQSFEQTFDQLSGDSGGSPEPGSAFYQPQIPQQPVGQPPSQPVAEPPQLPPGATTAPARAVVQGLRQRGWEVDEDWNDDQFLTELGGLLSSIQNAPSPDELERYRQLSPQLYEFAAKRPEFEKWLQQQGSGAQAASSAATQQQVQQQVQQPSIQAPPVDPFAQQLVEMGEIIRDEKGIYTTRRPELHAYTNQLNARESHVRKFRTDFETDPEGFIKKFVDPLITEKSKLYEEKIKELETHLSQQSLHSAEQKIDAYFKDNLSRFWMHDQSGQQVYGFDGNPVMTQAGAAYANAIRLLEGTIADPVQRHETAVRLIDQTLPPQPAAGVQSGAYPQQFAQPSPVDGQFSQQQFPQQQQPQQAPAQVQQQRNANFLQRNRINQQLNGNGHMPAPGYPNVLPQGDQVPDGNNSFEYLFDQMEATRS